MLHRLVLPGEQKFDEDRWADDILNKCHFDNRLWGYTIQIIEELRTCDPAVFTDGVLYNLMRTLGANPYLPTRYVLSSLWVLNQNTQHGPTRSI